MLIRRTLNAGEEILTDYGWDLETQLERRCGYEYSAGEARSHARRQTTMRGEEEITESLMGDSESEEEEEDG
jgi:hypothetical protein